MPFTKLDTRPGGLSWTSGYTDIEQIHSRGLMWLMFVGIDIRQGVHQYRLMQQPFIFYLNDYGPPERFISDNTSRSNFCSMFNIAKE
ncbi:hypothetical protein N7467_001856 [Penicillium canescens]|nr:hypothetical protein N7467_001856 [Penicillium canescens]